MVEMIESFHSKDSALMRKDYGELNTKFVFGSVDTGDNIRKRLAEGGSFWEISKKDLLIADRFYPLHPPTINGKSLYQRYL